MTQTLSRQAASVAELRSINNHRDTDTVYVRSTKAIYLYVAASLAVDDGAETIKPANILTAQAGRWVREGYIADPGQAELPQAVGGSGVQYSGTFAAALAAEAALAPAEVTFTPASATAGTITGPGTLSAANDAYNGYEVVDMDAAPGNGLVGRRAKVLDYDGTTKVLTIDKPWNFTGEVDLVLTKKARVVVTKDIVGDISIDKSVEVEFGGHKVTGKIDIVPGGALVELTNIGGVTNGIQNSSRATIVMVDDKKIETRDGGIYSFINTNGVDYGRVIMEGCTFAGVIAGRRGYGGWEVYDCRTDGAPETDSNFAWRLFEAPTGITLAVKNADFYLRSEFPGAIFYTEDTGVMTGATAAIYGRGALSIPKRTFANSAEPLQPCLFSVSVAKGAAQASMTAVASSRIRLHVADSHDPAFTVPGTLEGVCNTTLVNFTGTYNFTWTSMAVQFFSSNSVLMISTLVTGSVTCSGTVTLVGVGLNIISSNTTAYQLFLAGKISSNISDNGSIVCVGVLNTFARIRFNVNQDAGTPSFTFNGSATVVGTGSGLITWSFNAGIAISGLGTVTCSGAMNGRGLTTWSNSVSNVVTVGIFVTSSDMQLEFQFGNGTSLNMCTSSCTTATVTNTLSSSGINITIDGMLQGLTLAGNNDVAGAQAYCTATTIRIHGGMCAATFNMVRAGGGTGALVKCTGTIYWDGITFFGGMNMSSCDVAGNTAEMPVAMEFIKCHFKDDVKFTSSAVGTTTWSAASMIFKNCFFDVGADLYLPTVAQHFTTLEWYDCTFLGDIYEGAGIARPTTYRFWQCNIKGTLSNNGQYPDIIKKYQRGSAAGSITRGQLIMRDPADNTLKAVTAGNRVVGVALDTQSGGTLTVIEDGRVPVKAKVGVTAFRYISQDIALIDQVDVLSSHANVLKIGQTIAAEGAVSAGVTYTELAYSELSIEVGPKTYFSLFKIADEAVANQTLQTDDDITGLPVAAGGVYKIRALLFFTSAAAAAGAKVALSQLATATITSMKIKTTIFNDAGAVVGGLGRQTVLGTAVGFSAVTGDFSIVMEGLVEINAAGTLKLEWAQNATDAAGTTLQRGSELSLERIK